MFKALLKINLASILNWLTGGSKKNSGKSKGGKGKAVLYAVLMLYVLGVFAWMFTMTFGILAEPLADAGYGWLFFALIYLASFALMFIFSVFSAKSSLYEAKDNDLLLSMPIPPSAILGSRMLMLFGINLLFGALVAVPGVFCWFSAVGFDFVTLITFIVTFLALCFFALAMSAFFGWLLALASARMRKKVLFETVLSLVFLAAYIYFYSQLNTFLQSILLNSSAFAESIGKIFLVYWMGEGAMGNIGLLLAAIAVLIAPFIIVYAVLSRSFVKTATTHRGTAKVKYEAKPMQAASSGKALIRREAARFFSSSVCIINNGLGAIFTIAVAVLLVVYKSDVNEFLLMMPGFGDAVFGLCSLLGIMLAGMVLPTSSSVSLEGKAIWIVQSMPVSPAEVLRAKLRFCLTLYLPPLALFIAAAIYVFEPSASIAILGIILPIAAVVVMAEIGLICNVRHPSLNWTTESQAVKSGASVFISMLLDFAIVASIGLVSYLLFDKGIDVEKIMMGLAIVFLLAARYLLGLICGRISTRFANIA